MSSDRTLAAIARARADARTVYNHPAADGVARTVRLVVGDPQAPIETFFEVLELHGLLGDDGRLRSEVQLVSVGDHFDWGPVEARDRAADDGLALLSWLCNHPPDQVIVLAGNHDLARVGELCHFDDETFRAAQREADEAYRHGRPQRPEADFCAEYRVPSWEVIARDLSAFQVAQRTLVTALLGAHRLRAAYAASEDLLVCHAGLTIDTLGRLGLGNDAPWDAKRVASVVDRALDEAVDAWTTGPLCIPHLHAPGGAGFEGGGSFYHRASMDAATHGDERYSPESPTAGLGRRFHPSRLPRGLVQVVGHVRDRKCRTLLHSDDSLAADGPLRHLRVDAYGAASYARGVPDVSDRASAFVVYVDGGMLHTSPGTYELFDLDRRRPASRH